MPTVAAVPAFLARPSKQKQMLASQDEPSFVLGSTEIRVWRIVYTDRTVWRLFWTVERLGYFFILPWTDRHADRAVMEADAREALLVDYPWLTQGYEHRPQAIAGRVNALCKDGVLCVDGSYEAGCLILEGYCAVVTTDRKQSFYAQFRCDVAARRSVEGQWTVRAFRGSTEHFWTGLITEEQHLAAALHLASAALRRELKLCGDEPRELSLLPGLARDMRAAGLDSLVWGAPAVAPDRLRISAYGAIDAPGASFGAEVQCWVGEAGRLEYAAMAHYIDGTVSGPFHGETIAAAVGELTRRIDEMDDLEREMVPG